MITQEKKFRLKFILADNRKVYASKRGVIEEKTERELSALDFASVGRVSAYSKDLSMFGNYQMFERAGVPFVRVKSIVKEDASKPLDADAFTQNGKVQP